MPCASARSARSRTRCSRSGDSIGEICDPHPIPLPREREQGHPPPWGRVGERVMFPSRIVCLTEEPTEVLYALGEERRIVGISGFTVRPARARKEKPKVSAFTSANVDAITRLAPDLVIGFSDIQADIARELIARGVEVWIANHRTVAGILGYVRRLGAIVGAAQKAERYAAELAAHVEKVRAAGRSLPRHPRVYFEEWDDPMISGIGWVSELTAIAGGEDIFPGKAACALGRERIVADGADVIERAPD